MQVELCFIFLSLLRFIQAQPTAFTAVPLQWTTEGIGMNISPDNTSLSYTVTTVSTTNANANMCHSATINYYTCVTCFFKFRLSGGSNWVVSMGRNWFADCYYNSNFGYGWYQINAYQFVPLYLDNGGTSHADTAYIVTIDSTYDVEFLITRANGLVKYYHRYLNQTSYTFATPFYTATDYTVSSSFYLQAQNALGGPSSNITHIEFGSFNSTGDVNTETYLTYFPPATPIVLSPENTPPGVTPPQGNYDIFLCIGQSNMVGNNDDGIDPVVDAPDPRVFQFYYDPYTTNPFLYAQAILPLQGTWDGPLGSTPNSMSLWGGGNSMFQYSQFASSASLAFTFAKTYANRSLAPGRYVLLIPSAFGGTGLYQGPWSVGGDTYNNAIKYANHAILQNSTNAFKGILWLQGEADIFGTGVGSTPNSVNATLYQQALDAMIAGMRQSIVGASGAPFILGEPGPHYSLEETTPIFPNIVNTPFRVFNTCVACSADMGDFGGHFNKTSLHTLGVRFYNCYNQILAPSQQQPYVACAVTTQTTNPTTTAGPSQFQTSGNNNAVHTDKKSNPIVYICSTNCDGLISQRLYVQKHGGCVFSCCLFSILFVCCKWTSCIPTTSNYLA
jgi:hypothetical protein